MKLAPSDERLSLRARRFLLCLNILLGIVPSLAFFAWIERNCSLPWIAVSLHWPWLDEAFLPTPALLAWNFTLITGFGLAHSLLAQQGAQAWMRRAGLPPQALRTAYLSVTGLASIAVMGLWQNTGVVLWALALPPLAVNPLSFILFWTLFSGCGMLMHRFGLAQFFGIAQLSQSRAEVIQRIENAQLVRSGLYAVVRHPIYLLGALAIAITPVMSLDRASLLLDFAIYLAWGIPLEERKLVSLFADEYRDYRKTVPAVLPRLRRKTFKA